MLTLALAALLSQYTNPYTGVSWNNPMSSYLDTVIYNRIWARATNKADKPAPKSAYIATDFKPVQPRSVAQALISSSKSVDKAAGKALVEGLNAGLDAFEKEARKNNVAYAIAFLIGISQQTLSGKEITDDESEALAQAINDELAASPQYKKVPAKQKQLLYETSIIVGALIGGMAAMAAEDNDAEMRKQAKTLATQALQTFQNAK